MPWNDGEFVLKTENLSGKPSDTETKNRNSTTSRVVREDQPMANEAAASIGIAAGRGDLTESQRVQKLRDVSEDAIFTRLQQSPEVISLFQAIIDDVIGPGATFHYVGREDGDNNGSQSIRNAKQFWNRNQETYANCMIDELAVGDMYVYKRSKSEAEVREAARTLIRSNYNFNYKASADIAADSAVDQLKQETDMFSIQELTQVPAITVEHEINKYGDITAYRQKVGSEHVELDPDRVMHDSFMNLNGKTYGFTPFLSLFTELDMLANAKNHNAKIFDNAGVVNKIFKMPDEGPNDQNFEMVKQTIAKYRKLRNKHRDLVLTGNIEVEDMNAVGDSMEFRELAQYVTSVLVMAWGVPPTRVGVDISGQGAGGRGTQLSHEGYFKRIKRLQRKHAAFLNEHLFEPVFNVHIEFNNPDTKQEIREADRDLRRLDVAKQHAALGLWDAEALRRYLDIDQNQLSEDFSEDELQERAAELAGLQDSVLDDETVNSDTAEDAARMDLQEGQNEQEIENNGVTNDQ